MITFYQVMPDKGWRDGSPWTPMIISQVRMSYYPSHWKGRYLQAIKVTDGIRL